MPTRDLTARREEALADEREGTPGTVFLWPQPTGYTKAHQSTLYYSLHLSWRNEKEEISLDKKENLALR